MSRNDENKEQRDEPAQPDSELNDEELEEAAGGCWAPSDPIPGIEPLPGPTFPTLPFEAQ